MQKEKNKNIMLIIFSVIFFLLTIFPVVLPVFKIDLAGSSLGELKLFGKIDSKYLDVLESKFGESVLFIKNYVFTLTQVFAIILFAASLLTATFMIVNVITKRFEKVAKILIWVNLAMLLIFMAIVIVYCFQNSGKIGGMSQCLPLFSMYFACIGCAFAIIFAFVAYKKDKYAKYDKYFESEC